MEIDHQVPLPPPLRPLRPVPPPPALPHPPPHPPVEVRPGQRMPSL